MRHAVFASGLAMLLAVHGFARAADDPAPATGVAITDDGAKCDGATDDTTAINRMLAAMKSGGLIRIPAGRTCLIASGDLNVPENVIVAGSAAPWPSRGDRGGRSGFVLNPAYTIVMHHNAALRDLAVLRDGLLPDPTDAQVIEAVETWGKETSTGITLEGGGVRLEHLFIEGFNTAIASFGWGTFIISDVMGDDYNGLFVTGAGDNMAVLDTRFEPFYGIHSHNAHVGAQVHPGGGQAGKAARLHSDAEPLKRVEAGDYAAVLSGPHAGAIPPGTRVVSVDPKSGDVELSQPPTVPLGPDDTINFGGSWVRPGVAFYFQGNGGNTTGWYCERCFSFMYRHGAVIDGAGIGTMSDADFEYQHAFDPGTDGTGTFGIRLAGGSAGVSITQSSVSGQAIPFIDDMAPSHALHLSNVAFGYPDFIITAGAPGQKAAAGAWFSGRTGEPVIVTLAGQGPAGAEQALTVNGQTFTYASKRGAPPRRVLGAWGRMINSDPVLVEQHVVAYGSGDNLSIFAPPSVTLAVVPHVSGSLTADLKKGKSSPGSWGFVNGFTYNGPARIPAVVVGPHDDLSLAFSNFPGDNKGNVPTGAFAIDPSDTNVQFLTWAAGEARNNTLSACGRGPSLAPGSSALRGTITEGAGAEGCMMTFPAAFPRAPICTVSSPTGSPLSGYTATERTLTIHNRGGSGNQYSFMCSP